MRGFTLVYIGTQNTIEDFWDYAPSVNAVLVSCMDGHARTYLRDFAALKMRNIEQHQPIWFLGGNPSVEKLVGGERQFLEMGFDHVYLGFVEVDAVMDALERAVAPLSPHVPPEFPPFGTRRRAAEWLTVSSGKMPLPDLEAERTRVFEQLAHGRGRCRSRGQRHDAQERAQLDHASSPGQ